MITVAIAGGALGMVVSLVVAKTGRGRALAAGYGIAVAALILFAAAAVQSNRIEGMGGLPYAAGAGILLWFVLIPTAFCIGFLEWQRRGSVGSPTSPGGPERPEPPTRDTEAPGSSVMKTRVAGFLLAVGGMRGAAMRVGCIMVLLMWGGLLLGHLGSLASLLLSLTGWVVGGRWEAATRASPHRLGHSLMPWIFLLPSLVSWAFLLAGLWHGV